MIITYKENNYELDNGLCEAFRATTGQMPDEKDLKIYLKLYTKQDPEVSLRTLAPSEVSFIVSKCIKDEIINLYGKDVLEKYMKNS